MSSQLLNLPINIPWCQIAVTEQMMDRDFGDKKFPAPWRSSIAISAYEPKTDELPEEFSDKQITYLKITCSITGYQPTREETARGYADLDDGSTMIRQIFDEYLACYGVMLNVAVFSAKTQEVSTRTTIQVDDDIANYPHIIAIEPKNRDLYQSVTENGEMLTTSNAKVSTDKTSTQTESTETGLSLAAEYKGVSAGMTHKWGSTDQDSNSIQTDASRERRETQGTTTQLSQMYNLLTGYHQGTNRATFLMLPRPHTLQATDRRTFVQGLRVIEGVQEFMLIVERPSSINSLCVEVFLETGHFPEDPKFDTPKQQFDEINITKPWGPIYANFDTGGIFGGSSRSVEEIDTSITVEHLDESSGFELDISKGSLSPGISEVILPDDTAEGISESVSSGKFPPIKKLREYVVNIQPPNQLSIKGKITSGVGKTTTFDRNFIIHLRRHITEPSEPHTTVTDLLITQRSLKVCIKSGDGCPKVVKDSRREIDDPGSAVQTRESIVNERKIRINSDLLTSQATSDSRLPATKELLRQVQNAMTTSGRLPSRYPAGKVSYLESDYFKNRIAEILPREKMEMNLASIDGLPDEVIKSLGGKFSVAEALELNLSDFARRTSLSIEDAAKVRLNLLGMKAQNNGDVKVNSDQSDDVNAE